MSETEIKAVIFDLDGVIVDSEPVHAALFDRWMWEHDFSTALQEEINQALAPGMSWEDVFMTVNRLANTSFDIVQEHEQMADRIVRHVQDVGMPLKPGAGAAIKQLAERYQLGIASNSRRRVIERSLRHHALHEYFRHITGSEDVTYGKPHPEPYQKTMAALRVQPEETIVIEDSLSGARSAAAAGIFVYVIPDDPTVSTAKLAQFGKVVPNFDAILKDLP